MDVCQQMSSGGENKALTEIGVWFSCRHIGRLIHLLMSCSHTQSFTPPKNIEEENQLALVVHSFPLAVSHALLGM